MTRAILYSVTRSERATQVASLRSQGLTYAEIGARLGIAYGYVRDLLSDPDGSALAARRHANAGTCQDCGGPTSGNGGRANAPPRCAACHTKRVKAQHGTQSRYNAGCACDDCRRANREAARRRRGRTPPSHGDSGYTNYGCRCQKCREAHLVYMRARGYEAQKNFAKRVRGTEPPKHGTPYAYNVYGCRCEVCRAANSEYHRIRRAAHRQEALA